MKIAITSPAGKVDSVKLTSGVDFLKSLGHDVILGRTLIASEFWTAGAAALRASELQQFWNDDSIDVVWAARGGFGCAHLLDLLDWQLLSQKTKILCGHSDISILHLAFYHFGVNRTISAAMPAVELNKQAARLTINSTFDLISSASGLDMDYFKKCRILKGKRLSGKLMPVTLSVLCSMLGTPYLPDLTQTILVLEDVNESGYRLDSYLNQLRLSNVLSKLSGLIFADFKNCGTEEEMNYIMDKYKDCIDGAVLTGLPFGHCEPRLSLPVGEFIDLSL